MGAVGNLLINTKANTGYFVKGVKTMRSSLGGLQKAVFSAKGAFVGLAGIMGLSVGYSALKSAVSKSMSELDELAKFADTVNLKVSELRGLQLAAGLSGSDQATLEKGLQRLVRRIGEAKQGLGEGQKALATFGITAQDLSSMSTIDVLKTIADKIKELPDATSRAAAAYQLFGRQGQELQKFLEGGGEAIDDVLAKSAELGGAFDRVELAQVEAANDRIAEFEFLLDNVTKRLSIALIPYIEIANEKLTEFFSGALDGGNNAVGVLEQVGSAVGFLGDLWDFGRIAFLGAQTVITKGLAYWLQGLSYVANAFQNIINLIPGVSVNVTDFIDTLSEDLHKLADEQAAATKDAFVGGNTSDKVLGFFDSIQQKSKESASATVEAMEATGTAIDEVAVKATQSASDLVTSLQEQIDTFGMSSEAAKLWKLQQEGASEPLIEQAKNLYKQIEAMEEAQTEQEKLESRAESIIEASKSDLEKVQDQISELDTLLARGLIDEKTYRAAQEKALEGINNQDAGQRNSLESLTSSIQAAALKTKDKSQQQLDQLTLIAKNGKEQLQEMKKRGQLVLA